MTKISGIALVCLVVISLLLGGCSQPTYGRLTHHLTIVIGEHMRDIDSGKLVIYLFAYDPSLADAPADEIYKREIHFRHRQGQRTSTSVVLVGEVPYGYRPYVVVRGYEQAGEEWRYILWDGQTQTGMPSTVEMRWNAPVEGAQGEAERLHHPQNKHPLRLR